MNVIELEPMDTTASVRKTRTSVRTLVVCSGGLDSVALAHKIAVEQSLIHLVSFDYGQHHRKELAWRRSFHLPPNMPLQKGAVRRM
jgi:hypothetical protein